MTAEYALDLYAKIRQIRLVGFDVDGVLTDGKLYFDDQGVESKAFNVKDGLGLVHLLNQGIEVAIITGRSSPIVTQRMANLGIKYVYQGQSDKMAALEDILADTHLKPEQVAYLGDDLPDLPLIERVGLGCAVADAVEPLKASADWLSQSPGGHGAARELADLILTVQGSMDEVLACYRS